LEESLLSEESHFMVKSVILFAANIRSRPPCGPVG